MPRRIDLARTSYLFVPGKTGIKDPKKPTLAELTASGVVNISEQVVQSTDIGQKPSDTTDERPVTANSNAKTPTIGNYDGTLVLFRELDEITGLPVLVDDPDGVKDPVDALALFPEVGIEHWIVKRTGPPWDAAYAAGQYCETYQFIADVITFSGGKQDGFLKATITELPSGQSSTTAKIVASA